MESVAGGMLEHDPPAARQQFLFLTKRIHRFTKCIPSDWGQGYDNVTVGCTVEDQERADEGLSLFARLPIKHKNIICQPLIGPVELERYLGGVELVVVGGESDTLPVRELCSQARKANINC